MDARLASPHGVELREELAQRAVRIVDGMPVRPRRTLPLSDELCRRIGAAEARARALADASGPYKDARRAAALEFLASTVTALLLENACAPGESRGAVNRAGEEIGVPPGAARLAVFLRALRGVDAAQLPPRLATDLVLALLCELGPATGASLWTGRPGGRAQCIAESGGAPRSRRLRDAARTVLDGGTSDAPLVRAVPVERWDRPHAVLAARARIDEAGRLSVYLREAASALSPVLEREMLFARNAARERSLVSAGERRLVRLGFDIHDGPLQELVALAEDMRLARDQVEPLLDGADRARARGRFDDLDARLDALGRSLRDIAHSVRATTAVERPLEHVLRTELDALTRASGMKASLAVDGDPADLTDSQKIALYRVVQESLSNARKHSGASRVAVRLHTTSAYVGVSISDNGRGFANGSAPDRDGCRDRLGLAGICERVRLLGGDVEIGGRAGEGVTIRATLPRWAPIAGGPSTAAFVVPA